MIELMEFLNQFNLPTVLTTIGAMWYFTRDIKREIKEIRTEMHTDNLAIQKEFKFINIRLSRVEGTMYGKDIYKVDKDE